MGKSDFEVAKDLIYLYSLKFFEDSERDDELEKSVVIAVDHVLNPNKYVSTENCND